MILRLVCPNGHRLATGDNLAGKRGKCPKCGAAFVVPKASPANQEPIPVDADDTIEFLCPNGHVLRGPARLQGRPGQCPHCGEKFRIPNYDEEAEEEEQQQPEPAADQEVEVEDFPTAGPDPGAEVEPPPIEAQQWIGDEEVEILDDVRSVEEVSASDAVDGDSALFPRSAGHPLARAFARLWTERGEAECVELLTRQGEVIAPDHYAPTLSQHDYGVFAVKTKDGQFTVTIVPWSEVVRVGLRHLPALPDGLFE